MTCDWRAQLLLLLLLLLLLPLLVLLPPLEVGGCVYLYVHPPSYMCNVQCAICSSIWQAGA